jgi:hypothetical protein
VDRRRFITADGEQGTILDSAKTLRHLSRRKLRRMILAKDYLECPESLVSRYLIGLGGAEPEAGSR